MHPPETAFPPAPVRHPLARATRTVREALKSVADVNPTFVPTPEEAHLLAELVALEAQVAHLRLRVMASAADVAEASGDRSIATWLSRTQRLRRSDCAADLRLAEALDHDRPLVADALGAGELSIPKPAWWSAPWTSCPPAWGPTCASGPRRRWCSTRPSSSPPRWPDSAAGSSTSSPPRWPRPRRLLSWPGSNAAQPSGSACGCAPWATAPPGSRRSSPTPRPPGWPRTCMPSPTRGKRTAARAGCRDGRPHGRGGRARHVVRQHADPTAPPPAPGRGLQPAP